MVDEACLQGRGDGILGHELPDIPNKSCSSFEPRFSQQDPICV
jgi:hypothetical protein